MHVNSKIMQFQIPFTCPELQTGQIFGSLHTLRAPQKNLSLVKHLL